MAMWDKITSRGNVEDRRGMAPMVGGISITGVALLLLVNYATGGDLGDFLQLVQQNPNAIQNQQITSNGQQSEEFAGKDSYEVFASTVLGSANDVWDEYFRSQRKNYTEPILVLFRQATESACGGATSAVGPHYCPLDNTIYLDETFFDELTRRFGARGGDVAQAYVIAHEVGHHVQNVMGTIKKGQESNDASVKVELQADCFAGIWANSLKDQGVFEKNEILEAMDAAEAVGDDRIQESVNGQVNPESWTHGSSAQRVEAFTTGYESGDVGRCRF